MHFCHIFQCLKANFSGLTKIQKFARKIPSYSLTLESLHTVKKLFCHSGSPVYLIKNVVGGNSTFYVKTRNN